MALTNGQLADLAAELINDPKGLGYAGKDDPTCADLLNTSGLSSETGPTEPVSVEAVKREVVVSEFRLLSLPDRQFWQILVNTGGNPLDPADSKITDQIRDIWQPSDTWDNIAALGTRDYSRAEALFDRGVSVTLIDVGRARTGDY